MNPGSLAPGTARKCHLPLRSEISLTNFFSSTPLWKKGISLSCSQFMPWGDCPREASTAVFHYKHHGTIWLLKPRPSTTLMKQKPRETQRRKEYRLWVIRAVNKQTTQTQQRLGRPQVVETLSEWGWVGRSMDMTRPIYGEARSCSLWSATN